MATPPLEENLPLDPTEISVNHLIVVGLLTRLVTDTAVQIFFPFLPVIAEGLRSNTVAVGRLVSLRSAMGLFSPLFGYLAYLRGYRQTMRLGLLLAAVGYFIVGMSSNLWLAAIGMVLGGLGTFAFVPILQAYLSARLPFNRRARGLGMLEYAWALAGIVGLYLFGLVIEAYSWRVPLFFLSGLLLLAFLGYGRLPAAANQKRESPSISFRFSAAAVRGFFELGNNRRSAWAVLLVVGLNMMAAMNVFINYGTWLAREYSYSAAQLGTVALILGITDLVGSVLMSLIGDQLGLRRGVMIGALLAGVGYGLLPVFNQTVVWAIAGLIIARFAFEFTVVGLIALVSEQASAYRGKMMTLAAAAALLGSSIAGFFSPAIYDRFAVPGLSVISIIIVAVGLVLLLTIVQEREEVA